MTDAEKIALLRKVAEAAIQLLDQRSGGKDNLTVAEYLGLAGGAYTRRVLADALESTKP